ncbi:hypothetical protein [Pedobacter metabolipauper]|uniref:Uncharacterized protein n=1 Tax=Pedobacter metabolipauper TaxID=425513 RepID=A0A4R6T122_9SPHI|nr:hypothetical protein [Pedobacter metabolipauper]TDQ11180.1 hypothetical protein ATK78_0296 [Pedobacter metabolipauper]
METNLQQFKNSLKTEQVPFNLSLQLQALWYDGKGNWKTAHDLIDQESDRVSAHVHAYLHRKEGDLWNADYWYSRAGKSRPDLSLTEEWEQLVSLFLK